MKRSIALVSLMLIGLLAVFPGSLTQAASAAKNLAPVSIVTQQGSTTGAAVAKLAVRDQSGTADNPAKYVAFNTPGKTAYHGYRQYALPAGLSASTVTAMQLTVNYKGPGAASQLWSWYLYDWTVSKWVVIGNNASAMANTWSLLSFSASSPARFINAARQIRVLLVSGNASGNAKLDFEAVNLTYTVPPTPNPAGLVYTDKLQNGWGDWSWGDAVHSLANTSPVHSGARSIAVTYGPAGWSGLQFGMNTPFDISNYDELSFWIHGGTAGRQKIVIQVSDGSTQLTQAVTPQAGAWKHVLMPLTGLTQVTLIAWFNNTAGAQPKFYVDDVAFLSSGAPTPTPLPPSAGPDLSVDASAGRRAISPYIYGMNWADENLAADLALPVRRWGGNAVSRYNWQLDIQNTGSDWYFENIANPNDGTRTLPDGSTADLFVEQDRRTSTKTLMTLPLIGWTPKGPRVLDHPYPCGFQAGAFSAQDSFDPWDPNCGNGVHNGLNITGNNPAATSLAIDPTFDVAWMNHLIANYGTAAGGGVKFYDLDNEPMLWNSTHRDVHPQPTSYDEMRTKTLAYAAAAKAADPGAQILGPAEWGWCGYFYSAVDGCSAGTDRQAHGNLDFVPWYLQQLKAYETQNGTRLLDYLDLHFYPQADGIFSDGQGSAALQALRLRSTRALWDPTYVDESWIGQTIYMIPRMHAWVDDNYPGTKISLSEYSWGAMGYMNGALAEADVLGIFGREGLDLATLWGPPTTAQPGAYAFRMYLNYDGSHSQFGDTAVNAASADQDRLAVYAAQRTGDSALTLMIINKTAAPLTSALSLAGFTPSGNGQVYQYSAANLNAIQHLADQDVSSTGFSATYPANSITLVVIPGSAP